MPAAAPPRPLRVLIGASLALTLLTAAFAAHYTAGWRDVRAGRPIVEQRVSLRGVPWFKRPFLRFVEQLRRTVPPNARVLVEPSRVESPGADSRWYLFLNYYAYPIELYVQRPELASGTLVDFPRWLEHHAGRGGALGLDATLAAQERGIEWRLLLPVTPWFDPADVTLLRREGGRWVPHELAPWPATERER